MTDRFNPMPLDAMGDLRRQIDDLRRELREGLAAHTLEAATIGKGGLTVKGGQIVVQDTLGNTLATLDATGLLVSGTETVSGTLHVTGNTVIGGTLSLPAGIIDNDALTHPVVPGVARGSGSNFALGTGSLAEVAGVTLTVPAGVSQLLAIAAAYVHATNPNTTGGSNGTGGDSLYAAVGVGSQVSATYDIGLSGSGGFTSSSAVDSFIFTGLTAGSTLRLSAYGAAAYQSMSASTYNRATVSAALQWLK